MYFVIVRSKTLSDDVTNLQPEIILMSDVIYYEEVRVCVLGGGGLYKDR